MCVISNNKPLSVNQLQTHHKLGEGSFGSVWSVLGSDAPLAIKKILANSTTEQAIALQQKLQMEDLWFSKVSPA
jgi:hypothetical protein